GVDAEGVGRKEYQRWGEKKEPGGGDRKGRGCRQWRQECEGNQRNGTPAEAEHEQRPAPDGIDEKDRGYCTAKTDAAYDQSKDQRLLYIKMVDGAEQRGHPGGDAIGHEIGANPNKPHRY